MSLVNQLELRIPPLALTAVSAVAIAMVTVCAPLIHIPFPGHKYASAVLVVFGFLLAAVGVAQFRQSRTTLNPMSPDRASAVVTSGIYRVSRNPMYLGMALVLLGVAAWGSALAGYLVVVGFCWYLTRFQIFPEERALRAAFGEEFAQYMGRVRRWV